MTAYRVVALAVLASGCGVLTPDKPTEPPSVEVTADCTSACAHLRTIGCPEGNGAVGGESCAVVCERASQLRELPLVCWVSARDVAAARGCGSLRCIR